MDIESELVVTALARLKPEDFSDDPPKEEAEARIQNYTVKKKEQNKNVEQQ